MEEEDRPTKRIKIDATSPGEPSTKDEARGIVPPAENTGGSSVSRPQAGKAEKSSSKFQKKARKPQEGAENKDRKNLIRTFSQPSVMCVGDKGMFVTSDKGCEKKALLELHGILQDYFESKGIDASGAPISRESLPTLEKAEIDVPGGIEADIDSELAELRNGGRKDAETADVQSSRPMQLITLDIPCVSFVRFPTKSVVDPVEVVRRLCLEAFDASTPQRSRFIKRLTPISSLAKTLRQGLETVSEEVLPRCFGPDEHGMVKSLKFAIRPTIRENEQLDRDLIIKPVANRIQEIGKALHKVDLKNYEKGVIVEVYRGWIGMCVVDNLGTDGQHPGYEQLRRFNLSEIYAKR